MSWAREQKNDTQCKQHTLVPVKLFTSRVQHFEDVWWIWLHNKCGEHFWDCIRIQWVGTLWWKSLQNTSCDFDLLSHSMHKKGCCMCAKAQGGSWLIVNSLIIWEIPYYYVHIRNIEVISVLLNMRQEGQTDSVTWNCKNKKKLTFGADCLLFSTWATSSI